MEKECLNCGKRFLTNHEGTKYCSYYCYRLHVRKLMQRFSTKKRAEAE